MTKRRNAIATRRLRGIIAHLQRTNATLAGGPGFATHARVIARKNALLERASSIFDDLQGSFQISAEDVSAWQRDYQREVACPSE